MVLRPTPSFTAASTLRPCVKPSAARYTVFSKSAAKSAITCQLWKYTDKPGKAVREAAEAAGKDAPETDPHFYMAKAHLFHALQVEKSKR